MHHTPCVEETMWQRLSITHNFYVVNVCARWPNETVFKMMSCVQWRLIAHVVDPRNISDLHVYLRCFTFANRVQCNPYLIPNLKISCFEFESRQTYFISNHVYYKYRFNHQCTGTDTEELQKHQVKNDEL